MNQCSYSMPVLTNWLTLHIINWCDCFHFWLPFNLSSPVLTALLLVPQINEQPEKFLTCLGYQFILILSDNDTPSDIQLLKSTDSILGTLCTVANKVANASNILFRGMCYTTTPLTLHHSTRETSTRETTLQQHIRLICNNMVSCSIWN